MNYEFVSDPKGQGIVLCSGSDLMARLQTSRDREPTSVQ